MAISTIAAAILWIVEQPDSATWIARVATTSLALGALAFLFYLQFRQDLVPDYLYTAIGEYYNRDGFCFCIVAKDQAGVCCWEIFFQNQFDMPCVGRIAIRPNKRLFRSVIPMEPVLVEIDCEPAAFGRASLPVAVPEETQGTQQAFDVGVAVEYPQGKGRRLRFRDGVFLRANTNFRDAMATAELASKFLTGSLLSLAFDSPAGIRVALPCGVAEELPSGLRPEVETFWKLGDPPLG